MINRLLQYRPSTRLPALASSWASKLWAGAAALYRACYLAIAFFVLVPAAIVIWLVVRPNSASGHRKHRRGLRNRRHLRRRFQCSPENTPAEAPQVVAAAAGAPAE